MTNNKIFQEVAEKQGKIIEDLVHKYKDSMSLEEIEKDLHYSFRIIVSNICSCIELEEKEKNGLEG